MNKPYVIFVIALVIMFAFFGYVFRKKISYIFCPLEKYTGRFLRGKSSYIGLIHLILSFAFSAISFFPISDLKFTQDLFNNDAIRISSFILLLIIWLFIIGLLIEEYLIKSDKEYKRWKDDYLNKI